ncbi:unnamed protein product [Phytomonas sp. Hart1]|nr:unnamed protein product [Phytomonas sp. Hart1]|eukprot:CCW70628.1 unnamed protein product [Phytomonas sp. isolate Hart1]
MLCDLTETSREFVIENSLDVLLADCLQASLQNPDEGAARFAKLGAFCPNGIMPNRGFPELIAGVLYNGGSTSEKVTKITHLMGLIGSRIELFQDLMKGALASVVLNVISCEASAQLDYISTSRLADISLTDEEEDMEGEGSMSTEAFDKFCLAIRQAIALCDCGAAPSSSAFLAALEGPPSLSAASYELVNHLFDIIDRISGRMGVVRRPNVASLDLHQVSTSPDPPSPLKEGKGVRTSTENFVGDRREASSLPSSVSQTTLRRWLLGLCSFIRFMNQHATLAAAKLPSMLDFFYPISSLLEDVSRVWLTLIEGCTADYLQEHAPAMVVDLVNIDFATHSISAPALRGLRWAIQKLHARTSGESFWHSYFQLMGTTSRLMGALRGDVDLGFHVEGANADDEDATQPTEASTAARLKPSASAKAGPSIPAIVPPIAQAKVVVCGFLAIMRSSSRKCKAISLHALHEYLQRADISIRFAMSQVASENVEFLPVLLRASRELERREVADVLACLGVIGAMPPSLFRARPERAASAADPSSHPGKPKGLDSPTGGEHLRHFVASERYYLEPELVLSWRGFCGLLLEVYCPRALANTSDPVMHDRAAYAVQELLRVCAGRERGEMNGIPLRPGDVLRGEELARYSWWAGLPPRIQTTLEGFLTTRYSTLIVHRTERRSPEYRTGMPFLAWAFAVFRNLAGRCSGWFAEVLAMLRNVAKRDGSLIMFLLPYSVVHLLKQGDNAALGDLLHEFDVVFTAASAMGPWVGAGGPTPFWMSLRAQNPAEPTSPRGASHEWISTRTGVEEHARYLLHLLEDLHQLHWGMLRVGHRLSKLRAAETYEYVEDTCLRLATAYRAFEDHVEWAKRAQAGIAVGGFLRALRAVESPRRLPKLVDVVAAIPLQRVFAALGDRDSARSLHRLAHHLPASEVAFSLENSGDWLLAMQNCELVLQHEPWSIPHQFTLLRCMRHLGQLHLMARYAEASIRQNEQLNTHLTNPSSSSFSFSSSSGSSAFSSSLRQPFHAPGSPDFTAAALRNYANEAAWRLGEWEKVRTHPTLPVSLAGPVVKLMGAFIEAGSESEKGEGMGKGKLPWEVKLATQEQREKLIDIIQSTCREGYSQSYPHLVMLHGLADVDLVVDMLLLRSRSSLQFGEIKKRYFAAEDSFTPQTGGSDARDGGIAHLSGSHVFTMPSGVGDGEEEDPRRAVALVVDALKARLSYLDHSLEAREPILSLHRTIYRALGLNHEVSQTWIEHARLLRDAGFYEAALNAARQSDYAASDPASSAFYTLNAVILHDMNATIHAMEFAQRHAENKQLSSAVRAQLQLLLTNWKLEVGSQTPKEVISAYEAALELDPSSEEAHHHLALFYDKLYAMSCQQLDPPSTTKRSTSSFSSLSPAEKANMEKYHGDILQSVENYAQFAVKHFGKALLKGHETMSVSLPRMHTLWLDATATLFDLTSPTTSPPTTIAKADSLLKRLNNLIEGFLLPQELKKEDEGSSPADPSGGGIPPKVMMHALPQLLSRLCHPSAHVGSLLTRTIVSLMRAFPQQCLWMVLPIVFSHQTARAKIAKLSILNPFIQQSEAHKVHLENAYIILQSLIDLCNCPASVFADNAKLTQQPFIQKAEKIMPSARFILPTLRNFTPDLTADHVDAVFPGSPCFFRFDDKVRVMASLQMPKRVWVFTNHGDAVSFLCKAKDEPRKDIRMMEIAGLMNTFFLKDPAARRHRFELRRYAIMALTDDCAFIEWVNHLSPLRTVVSQTYVLDGTGVRTSEVKKWYTKVEARTLSKMKLFTQYILPAAPAVLHQWFDMAFASNSAWYQARERFTQSTALWSIAGHILGLGDRHGENLLMDLHRGELLHVDFACMFDKGETLEVPERVRFRLTPNLVDGMGVLGVEGAFRARCELALRCQIRNKKAVMSIVEILLHDPLVEWSGGRGSRRPAIAPKGLVGRVARRLDGFLDLYSNPREEDTLALSVEGQVSKLISHSSALENLSEMYIWWMAWI